VTAATWLRGILTVASALLPPERSRLRLLTELLPYRAADAATAVAAALGVLLLYLAGGLRQRKRRAWTATVAVTAVVAVSHLVKGLDVEEATAAAIVLALLLGCRHQFQAEADPGGHRLAVRRFVQLGLLGTALGMLLLRAYSAQLVGRPSLGSQLREVVPGLLGVAGPVRFASDRAADLVQIETLLRFNAKFRPAWQPRYLRFESGRMLPRVALAALEAEAFLVLPGALRRWLGPGCPAVPQGRRGGADRR
jgi:lysylphosphatidylglycerol synthetase-like protein (DUF2156 family)